MQAFLWQRRYAGCVGAALVYGPGGPDGPNGQDGGASVYPEGFAWRSLVWLGRRFTAGVCRLFYGNRGGQSLSTNTPLFLKKSFRLCTRLRRTRGGSKYTEADVSAFFHGKKSFSSSPRFPSPLIHKPEHGFEQNSRVGRTTRNVEVGFEDFFDTAASFGGIGVDTA